MSYYKGNDSLWFSYWVHCHHKIPNSRILCPLRPFLWTSMSSILRSFPHGYNNLPHQELAPASLFNSATAKVISLKNIHTSATLCLCIPYLRCMLTANRIPPTLQLLWNLYSHPDTQEKKYNICNPDPSLTTAQLFSVGNFVVQLITSVCWVPTLYLALAFCSQTRQKDLMKYTYYPGTQSVTVTKIM